MIVDLRELKPNPMRDFEVDPIDEGAVAKLVASIEEDGFWGGIVCRCHNGHIEIAAGHHRVEAARRVGITRADVFVSEKMDDTTLVRVYARENETQRGAATGTARAGSVAGALRLGLYAFLAWDVCRFQQTWPEFTPKAIETIRAQILGRRGIGRDVIQTILSGVPNVTPNTIRADLATLRRSGDYARIVAEVRDRIRREREEAERRAEQVRQATEVATRTGEADPCPDEARAQEAQVERAQQAERDAEQAAEVAAQEVPIFDFKGVAKHLKTPHHIEVFRDKVTSELVQSYLPLDQQEALAQRLVSYAEETGQELSGLFIRQHLVTLLVQLRLMERRLADDEREKILDGDWHARFKDLQNHFSGAVRMLSGYGGKLADHCREKPDDADIRLWDGFRDDLEAVKKIIDSLIAHL